MHIFQYTRSFHLGRCICLVFFLACSIALSAQDTASADGLFQMARKAAFEENNYPKAKIYCSRILEISPGYTDAKVFLGRLYSWNKEYDSARVTFENALTQQADYTDASLAYADVEYWTGNNDRALVIIDSALVYHPASNDLLLRKAKVFIALHRYKEANDILNGILGDNKTNTEARALSATIKDRTSLNKVGLSYDYVYFDKQFPDPWHLVSLEYTRQTKPGPIIGRINYASRFGQNGMQYEVESYPRLSKMVYAYTDIGYSDNNTVFPRWRGGLSLFVNLPHAMELEGGWRYLYFSGPANILTGGLAKYYRNYLFGVKTYITPSNTNIGQSYTAYARYYFGGADDFVALSAGTGISPDERSFTQQLNSKYKLTTYRAGVEFRHVIRTYNIIGFNFSFINQEYRPGTKGNQLQAGVKYQRRF